MATMEEIIKEKFPIENILKDLKFLTDNPEELKDYLSEEKLHLFILTFKHSRKDIIIADTLKDIANIYFVCSTDDDYLEQFKKELLSDEKILTFDKKDYVFDEEENGDNYGLDYPFNQCGCFARRFIDDYIRKNNIKYYMVSDNDVKIGIRYYNGKREEMSKEKLINAIKTYFYLLDKYDDKLSWLNVTSIPDEMGGKIYKKGWSQASYVFYFHNKPIHWRSRFFDDGISNLLTLKEKGLISLTLPYLRYEITSHLGTGDMSNSYKQLMKNLNKDIKGCERYYFQQFFKDIDILEKKTFRATILKKLLKQEEDPN